jgi:hypothetical protein
MCVLNSGGDAPTTGGAGSADEGSDTPRHGTQIVVPKHRSRDKNRAQNFADQQMAELATMKNKWASV